MTTSLTDLSPDGFAALADLDRRTLAELAVTEPADETERVAKEAMQERLGLDLARYDAGEVTSEVNVIASPLHEIRMVFDLMPTEGERRPGQHRRPARPRSPARWSSYKTHPARGGRRTGTVAAGADRRGGQAVRRLGRPDRRQLLPRAGRAARRGRARSAPSCAGRAAAATAATAEFGQFLRTELAPLGRDKQAAGRERYQLASQYFLGAKVDLDETYAWGFEELARLEAEMRACRRRRSSARRHRRRGGRRAGRRPGPDASRARRRSGTGCRRSPTRRSRELHGTHFDIPEQVRRIECCLAPTSDGGIYYTGPSEDFSRPGRMWWAVPQGIDDFSTWREVTTVYHEGVPGHHLQVAQTAVRAELLNRWQRLLCWVSGHGEGWALYAERLMDELGYLDDPGDKLGMLDGQAFRAARVIVDIGMHLELEIPRDNPFGFHPGERWTPELGWEFMRAHCRVPEENLRFELNRYLGWPGQAPSYKVGERIWLQAREDAKARKGADFDLQGRSTGRRWTSARWASTRCGGRWPGSESTAAARRRYGGRRRPASARCHRSGVTFSRGSAPTPGGRSACHW